MTLSEWAAERKTSIFEALKKGAEPEGDFDAAKLRDARAKGDVQMGATHFEPNRAHFEFIFPDALSTSTVVSVAVAPPERIVFLPVPHWVIEDVWQGEVQGTYHFETDAQALIESYKEELEDGANQKWFEKQLAKRRE
jgi:hypothetical protein